MARKPTNDDQQADPLDARELAIDQPPLLAPEPPETGAAQKSGYVVLARKYRPATLDDLIGQDTMVTTLRNAFAADRIAQAYMLTGVRGVGKTTTARILARALNYAAEGAPDRPSFDFSVPGRHCREIMEGRHPDVFEMDAASNTGVENIRDLIEQVRLLPFLARYKVFIIDEVHMLSKGAFNALLKTLEEPPAHVKFVFATTEIRKVPITVLSRCQRFDLRRVPVELLTAHFGKIAQKEHAKAEDEALALIARAAEGSVRDGLSILDQAIATSSGQSEGVTAASVRAMLGLADRSRLFALLEHVLAGRAADALDTFSSLHRDGADPIQTITDLADAVHLTTRVKVAGAGAAGIELSNEERQHATTLAERLSLPVLSRAWQMLLKGIDEAGRAPSALAAAEMLIVRMAHAADLPSPEDIITRLGGGKPARDRRSAAPSSGDGQREARGPLNAAPPQAPVANDLEPLPSLEDYGAYDPGEDGGDIDQDRDGLDNPETVAAPAFADPRSFAEVVELAGKHRDARLKIHLEDDTSLVKFDPGGAIELFLLPNAPPEIGNDLREKLNKWTGRRWVVALSNRRGERPIGEVRREAEAAELEALKKHPAVTAVFEAFPDIKIASVKPMAVDIDDDQATG